MEFGIHGCFAIRSFNYIFVKVCLHAKSGFSNNYKNVFYLFEISTPEIRFLKNIREVSIFFVRKFVE